MAIPADDIKTIIAAHIANKLPRGFIMTLAPCKLVGCLHQLDGTAPGSPPVYISIGSARGPLRKTQYNLFQMAIEPQAIVI
jgi:hypothetical protein